MNACVYTKNTAFKLKFIISDTKTLESKLATELKAKKG